jgi:hypothetical protein
MDRIPFRIAALVATALFVIVCSDARAQTDGAAPDPARATLAADASVEDGPSEPGTQAGGEATAPSGDASVSQLTQDPPPAPAPTVQQTVQPNPGPTPTQAPPPTPPSAPQTPSVPPSATGDPPQQRLQETPPAASAPAPDQASASTAASNSDPTTNGPTPPAATGPVSLPTPIQPERLPDVPSKVDAPPDGRLEHLLSDVGHRLQEVQGKIDHLRHRIAGGAPPRKGPLTDLRTSLVRIAPMLAVLEASLDAVDRLSPHLRQLLNDVTSGLHRVRAAAAGLIAALRHAGARGTEVQLLIQELERFRGPDLALPSTPAVGATRTPSPAVHSFGLPAVEPAPAVSPPPATAPPSRGAPGRGTGGSPDAGSSAKPPPSSAAPGATTASPAGGFGVGAVASLTMLLIGLMLPAIRARLDLAPAGRYTVAFLQPLERPG